MLKFHSKMTTPPGAVYHEPSTGYPIPWDTSYDKFLERVMQHKKDHEIPLTEGWKEEVEHQLCMTLKVDDPERWIYDTENPYVPRLVSYGRAMWAELHAHALAFPEKPSEHDKANEILWLQGWVGRIPSANCQCAYKWIKMGLDFDLSGREAYYESTVRVHNLINASLGKPKWGDGDE